MAVDMLEVMAAPIQKNWRCRYWCSGVVVRAYDVLATWRAVAQDVRGHTVPGGHFLPEEAPEETQEALFDFHNREEPRCLP